MVPFPVPKTKQSGKMGHREAAMDSPSTSLRLLPPVEPSAKKVLLVPASVDRLPCKQQYPFQAYKYLPLLIFFK
jgi:hypothetical protein